MNSESLILNDKSKELSLAISNVNETLGKIDLGTIDSTNNLESLVLNMEEVSNPMIKVA
ncbi:MULTISPECIES: hypothetical protein [Clostridium]|uniref:hypothetical protein n=1 Tax=Clostridium TaxID=1485 RepID=UPI00034BA265|nr:MULTISPECIES: hypothetical protein [Clostridium]NRT60294.1 hypothetical protein [Clostridium saccharoperbutylacetonicum]NSB23606.1 hypothetical protein [Clostridium saccharoperbutylacetonicum]NSB33476.1 hypothetical protein [Clostridium saccharoperbutylacetonicum]NSB42977.1 hypothetical protein [Clostridium saccharoperbutylacetonicum]